MTNFIETYKTDKSLCDDLIKFYHLNKHKHLEGTVGDKVSHNKKQSTELIMPPEEFFKLPEGQRYIKELQKCYFKYRKKYPYVDKTYAFNVNQNIKIQFYKPGQGFTMYHFENDGWPNVRGRYLTFMTYLNDVTDDGGTEFLYQKKITKAIKGNTVIWPAIFTHTHRGIVSKTQPKYIITGWWSFDE